MKTNEIAINQTKRNAKRSPPAISIVMPVYNTKTDYLKESIESTLNQTFTDFEFIIVDDGSTDTACVDFIKTYTDPRIRFIQNHHDFIDTLNKGMRESTGKYIARMDADDIMMPDRLKIQCQFMEEHPQIDICGSWVELFDQENKILKPPVTNKEIVNSLLFRNNLFHPTIVFRSDTVFKNRKDRYKKEYIHAEDYKLWTDLAEEGYRFEMIPEILLKYRSSESQVSRLYQGKMASSTVKIRREYAEAVMKKIIEADAAYRKFFGSLIDLQKEELVDLHLMTIILSPVFLDILDKQN